MFYRLRTAWNRRHFDRLTRGILETPPINIVDAKCSIISMVANSDVKMYILGMKSFYAKIGCGKVIVIIRRDMPKNLRNLLKQHIVGIQFVDLEDIDTGRCQRGGTWERLIYLLRCAQSEYAIQLDADTLTFGADLAEIVDCVKHNRAFALNQNNYKIQTMQEYSDIARNADSKYLGIYVEKSFADHPDRESMNYVRASSGLAGFAVGGFDPERIEEFHETMRGIVGDDIWRKWGTEQCGSNFAVANSPNAMVLPYPKYANFDPVSVWIDTPTEDNAFLHFIGAYRYNHDYFAKKAQSVIRELKAPTG